MAPGFSGYQGRSPGLVGTLGNEGYRCGHSPAGGFHENREEAHISDCNGGEEVNCKKTGSEVNDIHIPLIDPTSPNPQTVDECNSVTAEMIPHFRPATWSEFDMKTPVSNPVRVMIPIAVPTRRNHFRSSDCGRSTSARFHHGGGWSLRSEARREERSLLLLRARG